MNRKINNKNPFTVHPNEVGMTYSEHLKFALMLARKTFLASMASVIHAFFPFLLATFTSTTIKHLNDVFENRIKKINKNGETNRTQSKHSRFTA